MSTKKTDFNALTGIATAVFGGICTTASFLLPKATMGNPLAPLYFPATLSILLTLFGIMLFLISDKSIMGESIKSLRNGSELDKKMTKMITVTCILATFYAFIFEHAGFVISTILFLMGILFMTNGKKIVMNLIVSVSFSVGIFILFNHGLGIMLPKAFDLF